MDSFVPMWSFEYRTGAVLLIVMVVDKYHQVSYEVMEPSAEESSFN